jgi:uncharacterized membrane protein
VKINRPDDREDKFEKVISYLLMTGVILCILLEVIGVIMFYHAYGNLNISQQPQMFVKGHDFFSFIYRQFQNRSAATPAILFMIAGIVVLIMTPYLRVIASFLYFSWQKNWKYIIFTLFVLIVVTLSLTLH